MKGQYTQTLAEINRSLRAIQNQMNDLVDKMRKEDAKEQMLKTFYGVFSSGSPLRNVYIEIKASTKERAIEYMNNNFGQTFGRYDWWQGVYEQMNNSSLIKALSVELD